MLRPSTAQVRALCMRLLCAVNDPNWEFAQFVKLISSYAPPFGSWFGDAVSGCDAAPIYSPGACAVTLGNIVAGVCCQFASNREASYAPRFGAGLGMML